MLVTIEIDPARRTAAFREVSYLAAGDSCHVVLDGVRGADFGTLRLMLCRDAASESPVASCSSFSAVPNHPSLADGVLALDTSEMAEWFADAVPDESDSDSDSVAPVSQKEPRLAARASLAERSVRAEGWLVAFDSDRVWAACRVPVLLRPGAGTSGASDPSSIRALVSELVAGLVSAALADKADKAVPSAQGNLASLDASGNLVDSGATPASIKAAAVAEVVANAPGTMDTLKEIADILGSSQQTGTVLERILGLESGKVDKNGTAVVAGIDASATGDGAVAVGPKRSNGQGAGASAEGNTSVALGYWSRAAAFGAVQVGYGVNSTQNSFQFRGANLFAESASGAMLLGAGFPAATAAAPGSMSAADKEKLDGIASGATAVSVDATLTVQGAAADAKAVGDALRSGFTEWEATTGWVIEWDQDIRLWYFSNDFLMVRADADEPNGKDPEATTLSSTDYNLTATRHAFPPTKTSQLTNDGDGTNAFVKTNDPRLSDARTPTAHAHAIADVTGLIAALARIPDVTGKADKAANATEGNLAALDAQGNLADSGVKPSDFAAKADLPYALIETSVAYELSAATSPITYYDDGAYVAVDTVVEPVESGGVVTGYMLKTEGGSNVASYTADGTFVQWESSGWCVGDGGYDDPQIVLTGHLADRAGNRVVVSGDTTLTLPAAVPGYLRDFLVRLEISGSTVPTITFAAPTGETITYETDGDEFPVPDEAGTWSYSFTENCKAHTFAVSLKKVNTVAAPQAQGGA